MTIHWKAVEQYLTVVLFVFQFYPVCNFATKSTLTFAAVYYLKKGVINNTVTAQGRLQVVVEQIQ